MKELHIITFFTLLTIQSCTQNKETVLFSSSRNGNSDIFLMSSDGSNQTQLTFQETEEWSPTWISNNQISFLRQLGDTIIRVGMNLDTKREFKLEHPTNCILDDKNILYEPQNKLQLFSCQNDLFVYNPSTDTLINLTENLEGTSAYPSWGNDYNSVVFTSNHLGTNQIFRINLLTNDLAQLTDSDSNNERGELSPSGELLVYSSDYFEKGNQEILIKIIGTSEIINISESQGTELIARFSENGNIIYYGSNRDGNWEIYAYELNSKKTTRLTVNQSFDGDPRVHRMK